MLETGETVWIRHARSAQKKTGREAWGGRGGGRETHTVTARFAIPCNNPRASHENSVVNPKNAAVPSVIVNYFHAWVLFVHFGISSVL